MTAFNSARYGSNPSEFNSSSSNSDSSEVVPREVKFANRVLGELEDYVQCPMIMWDEVELAKVHNLLRLVDFDVQDAEAMIKNEIEEKAKSMGLKKCVICGRLTKGSVGAAGLKWSIICQECKDKEDKVYGDQIDATCRAVKKLIDGIDGLIRWVEEGKEDRGGKV